MKLASKMNKLANMKNNPSEYDKIITQIKKRAKQGYYFLSYKTNITPNTQALLNLEGFILNPKLHGMHIFW